VRRALVTGVTGQDGSYLAELLLERGYEVFGTVRGEDAIVVEGVRPVQADLLEPASLRAAVQDVRPDELYHLAAPTFVPASWDDPTEVLASVAGGTATLLSAAREASDSMRVWIATSSEIFVDAGESPQTECSPMRPRSPYGVAKLAAHGLVRTMRDHYALFACSGITYNHESPRRPEHFLPRKVTCGVAAIKLGVQRHLVLGNLDAVRDWSHAADVVRAAWLALQADAPDDYIVASGAGHTVRDLAQAAFEHVGLDWSEYVRVDATLVRPPEPVPSVGDPARARDRLGWVPEWSFEDLVAEMVDADLATIRARISG
jgi:GDPmannose 4,6-dehydratase